MKIGAHRLPGEEFHSVISGILYCLANKERNRLYMLIIPLIRCLKFQLHDYQYLGINPQAESESSLKAAIRSFC